MKKIGNIFLVFLLAFVFVSNSVLAVEFSDNFDTDPYSGRWTNEIGNAVWDSVNGEFDIANDSESAYRYSIGDIGSVDHEAQVTALLVSSERLMGPGVRFNNTGQNDMYGVSFESGILNIYRWNNGIRTHVASLSSGITATIGNYYSMRMSASGGVGNAVTLNVWIQDHGSTKPNDPGWIGNDNSPMATFTDSSNTGTRLDFSANSHTGIAGRANANLNDNRHDYFKARAIGDRGGHSTPSTPTDTTPPTITNITTSNITTTGATVSWTTNENSTSQLQYGLSTSYGTNSNSNGTTNHTVTLSNLTPNTTYNFRISATDASNNNTISTNQTFTTQQEVVVTPAPTADLQVNGSNSGVTVNSGTAVTLSWTSTNATSCSVTPGNYSGTSGTQSLSPSTNTTYTLSCSGSGGSASDSVMVSVSSATPPSTSGLPTPTGGGKYLYVSPSGDDSVSYANNSATNPWRTIGRATWGSTNRSTPNANEAARAGDVVSITGGTYTFTGSINSRFDSVYNPVNSGTAGNYITFVCSGDCILESPNSNSPVIGSSARNYIKWYADVSQGNSWVINACGLQSGCGTNIVNTTPDTGPVVCHASTGCHIEGATIDGTVPVDYTDNWNGIRVENSPQSIIKNNTIRNFRTQSNSRNASGVTLYGSANAIIENNQISNAAGGVYMKHNAGSSLPMTNVRVRFNNISDVFQCVSWSIGVGSNHFYQNVCTNATFGALITGGGLSNDWMFNNTFSGMSGSGAYISTTGTGGRFWNNICVNCAAVITSEGGPMPSENVIDFEHNVYRSYSNFYVGTDGNRTFSAFKSSFPSFEQSTPASIDADPLFLSSTDFRLQSGSPARNIGVDLFDLDGDGSTTDVIPAGAYITGNEIIGINSTGSSNPSPTTPPATPAPAADLQVNGSNSGVTVNSGTAVTLSWTSTNATSCSVTPGNYSGTSGTQSLIPTTNTTYTLSCSGSGGSTSDSITVSVNQVTTPTSTVFTSGQRIQTTANLNVRDTPSSTGTLLGVQPLGSLGTITGVSVYADGIHWWNVNYDNNVDGWSSEQFLQNYVAQTTTSTTTSSQNTNTNTGSGSSSQTNTQTTTNTTTGGGGGAPTTPSTPTTNSNTNTTPVSGGTTTTSIPSTPTTPTTSLFRPTLTRTIYVGAKGNDVTQLQNFLIATGYLNSGLNTGYFGPSTKQAVQRYQCATLKLCSGTESTTGYGLVGTKTRQAISSQTTTTTPTTTTTLTTEQRAAIQKQISDLLILVQQLMTQLKAMQGN